jgi:hypothetical protein
LTTHPSFMKKQKKTIQKHMKNIPQNPESLSKKNGESMRSLISIVVFVFMLSGCEFIRKERLMNKPYQSITSGPMAKLSFISPTYDEFILADTDLDMIIAYEAPFSNETCELDIKGRVRLDADEKEKSVFIPAGKATYILVTYFQNCFGCGSVSASQRFMFVPENAKNYTLEYKMKNGMFKVLIHEGLPGQKVADVELGPWYRCHKPEEKL